MMKKIFLYFSTYLIVTLISFFAFGKLIPVQSGNIVSPSSEKTADSTSTKIPGTLDFEGPKSEICPINGQKFTKEEKEIWSTRRPLMVMIENHSDARPQSGLSNADIVYEAVAEGGITRFMGVFYCNAIKGASNKYDVGPVRSARTYFLDIASEYSDYPLYTHVGGANCSAVKDPVTGRQIGACTTNKKALALEQIADYGWNNEGTSGDLSEFALSYKVCRREPERIGPDTAMEHTMYCSTKELWNIAADRGLSNETTVKKSAWDKNFKPWKFTAADTAATSTKKIAFDFWSGYKDYSVEWVYDPATNLYMRNNGGKAHLDINTQKQLSAKNIIIQFAKESRSIDEHLHNLYEMISLSGTGILFQNGQKTEITWTKASRTARTIFKDSAGQEVNFVPGQIWIEILPLKTTVTYEG